MARVRIRSGFRHRATSRVIPAAAWVGIAAALATACATIRVPAPAPGTATLFGTVRLWPHEGLASAPVAGAYGDRALRDAELVSYARPGFAVVTALGLPSPRGTVTLAVRGSRFGVRLEPRFAATGEGGTIALRNEDERAHVISCPAHGLLTTLARGAATQLTASIAGEVRCFVLDGADDGADGGAEASVYVAAGPFAVIGADGSWLLEGLTPPPAAPPSAAAPLTLHVWHPRFPPARQPVQIEVGSAKRVDVELQVR